MGGHTLGGLWGRGQGGGRVLPGLGALREKEEEGPRQALGFGGVEGGPGAPLGSWGREE